MNIDLHKKVIKVWLIIIAMNFAIYIGIALIEGVFGSVGDLYASAHELVVPDCMKDRAAALLKSLESNNLSDGVEKLAEMKSRILAGSVISILYSLICSYLLAFIMVKYLSSTVLLIGEREIKIKG